MSKTRLENHIRQHVSAKSDYKPDHTYVTLPFP